MHRGKELEAHRVEKGRLSCDSDAPKVGSAGSNWTGVVKVNRRKTNRRKTRPCGMVLVYCLKDSEIVPFPRFITGVLFLLLGST